MASVQDVLAFSTAGGCSKILEQLLCFLGGPSPPSATVDEAAVFLLVVMACIAGNVVAQFAGIVLAYLHRASGDTAMSLADLGRFIVLLFTLVSAWLFAVAVLLAFFYVFLIAGKQEIRPRLS